MNNNLNALPKMCKITEIAEMYRLPMHFVRALVNNGEVVAVRVGNKILVNADRFGEYLNTNTLNYRSDSAVSGRKTLDNRSKGKTAKRKSRIPPIQRHR